MAVLTNRGRRGSSAAGGDSRLAVLPRVEVRGSFSTVGAAEHWLLGLDDCYRLVGLIRSCWRGRSGGDEVWSRLPGLFTELGSRGSVMDRFGAPSHL
jgi:hypothetical protein